MRYRTFGASGLRVSELFLGAMTFGEQGGVGAPPQECRRILDAYADAGGNVIDTAINYRGGASEEILGELLAGRRDQFVLATKYTVSRDRDDPNAAGNHRKNMRLSLDTSLRRLRTDYLDIYWVHMWDRSTPVEETMRALDDEVRTSVTSRRHCRPSLTTPAPRHPRSPSPGYARDRRPSTPSSAHAASTRSLTTSAPQTWTSATTTPHGSTQQPGSTSGSPPPSSTRPAHGLRCSLPPRQLTSPRLVQRPGQDGDLKRRARQGHRARERAAYQGAWHPAPYQRQRAALAQPGMPPRLRHRPEGRSRRYPKSKGEPDRQGGSCVVGCRP